MDQLYDERGIKKIYIISRTMEWLATQDKTLQSVILGQADPIDTLAVLDLIRSRLEAEMASVSPAARIVDEAAAATKVQKRKSGQPPLKSA